MPVQASPAQPGPSASAPPGTPAPLSDSDLGSSILLLERVQKVLDQAVDGKAGQMSIDRSLLDEVRAEITQVKASLQGSKR
jgi:hypothetical protein